MSTQTHTPFWISEQSRPLMRTLATLGGVISAVLTIQFCIELGGRGVQVVPVMLGIFCEGLKFAAIGSGLWLIGRETRREKITGGCALCIAIVLIAGSVTASMGYLGVRDAQGRSEAWRGSAAYKAITQRSETLQGLLRASQSTAERYRDYGRVTKSTEHDADARRHASELRDVMDQLAAKEAELATGSDFFSGVAMLIAPAKPDRGTGTATLGARLRSAAYLMLALMLEAGCVLALQLLNLSQSRDRGETGSRSVIAVKPIPRSRRAPQTATPLSAMPTCVESVAEMLPTPMATSDEDADDCYARVREAVLSGEVRPAYRPLRARFELRQQTVRSLFQRLEADGVLVRSGQGFALASTATPMGFQSAM